MVVFDTNELVKLFARFRILRYEDTDATADFGLERAARRPSLRAKAATAGPPATIRATPT